MREREILAIIQREKDRSFWRCINYAMGKAKGGLVCHVITDDPHSEGQQIKHTTQALVQEAILDNIHRQRVFPSQICANLPRTPLRVVWLQRGVQHGWFGYNAVSSTACAVLNGTFVYPKDFDKATKEICRECAEI
jgi:hypothetical protein